MSDDQNRSRALPGEDSCLDTLEKRIEAVPPNTAATIEVPGQCPVSAADVLQLDAVRSVAFEQPAGGTLSPTRVLVEGEEKPADDA